MQLDRPERGFSYAVDAPLDMRMDPSADETAADIVNDAPERELQDDLPPLRRRAVRASDRVAPSFAAVGASRSLARASSSTTIKTAIPTPARFGEGHPAKRVFQALRIAVNDELGQLEEALPAAVRLLRPHGRIAVISFHSLEDRIVKHFFRAEARGCVCPPDFPVCACGKDPVLRVLTTTGGAAGRTRGGAQSALGIRAAARRGEGLMAATAPAARTRPPRPRPAKAKATAPQRTAQRRLAGGIVWIVVVAALLAGVVALNVAVLRVNLAYDELSQKRSKLRAENAALASKLASAASTGRIQKIAAEQLGATPASPDQTHIRPPRCRNARAEAVRPPHPPTAPPSAGRLRNLARARDVAADRARADLSQRAASQQHETVNIPAGRGTIVDRMGVQLAIGEEATTVYANPRQVTSPRQVAAGRGEDARRRRRRALPAAARQVEGLRVRPAEGGSRAAQRRSRSGTSPGVGFLREERRVYPQGGVAAHVLGYAGTDNRGLAGLELQLERVLGGRDGSETFVKDPFGRVLNVVQIESGAAGTGRLPHSRPHDPGQRRVRAPGDGVAVGSRSGQRPSCSMRRRAASSPWRLHRASTRTTMRRRTSDLHRNVAVTDTYEPGSTFKLVTVAAALSEGLVNESSPFTLPYGIQVADRVVHDAEPRGTETMTVAQILSRSSNVGAITLAQLLGPQRLARWIERFGFGKPTGIDFPGETPGIVLPVERWSGSTIGNVPIGQGIGVTAVQMAAAYAAVANGGVWIAPHLVDHVSGGGTREAGAPARALAAHRGPGASHARERGARGDGHARSRTGIHDRGQDRDCRQA